MKMIVGVLLLLSTKLFGQSDLNQRVERLEKIVALQHAKLVEQGKRHILVKTKNVLYTGSSSSVTTLNILPVNNLPPGSYRVTYGASHMKDDYISRSSIKILVNGAYVGVNDFTDGDVIDQNGIGYDHWSQSNRQTANGRTSTVLFKINTVSTVSMEIVVAGEHGQIKHPFYIIEKIPGDIKVMTSWN